MRLKDERGRSERVYEGVLRRVLWGDDREEVMHRLEVNGITGGEAERVYKQALAERITAIRSVYWKRIVWGAVLIGVGAALYLGIWFITEGFKVWGARAISLPAIPIGFGAWKLIDGLVGVMTAGSRSGPVSDVE